MKIKIERSGGFSGVITSREMNADKLSPVLKDAFRKLLDRKELSMNKGTKPMGAADYLTYKITLEDGVRNRVIECNQFDMGNDLKSLIKYVESHKRRDSR